MNLLFVDDDDIYWELFQGAIGKLPTKDRPEAVRLTDGAELMPYIALCETPNGPTWPDLILLDQRMPRMDGTQLLATLRADRRTRSIPVCLMSSSDQPHLVSTAYGLGANFYIVKPLAYRELCDKVRVLIEFFTQVATLPTGRPRTS